MAHEIGVGFFVGADSEVPVIYELDESGEASGGVHFFCSQRCRDLTECSVWNPCHAGVMMVIDIDPATVCENCGRLVAPDAKTSESD